MGKFKTRLYEVEHYTFELTKVGRTLTMTVDGCMFDTYTRVCDAEVAVEKFRVAVESDLALIGLGCVVVTKKVTPGTKKKEKKMDSKNKKEQRKGYVVYCSTGCTCCSSENHYRGPFSTSKIAEAKANTYRKQKVLVSQYALNGCYDIEEYDAEVLPDGRVIIDDTVFPGWAELTGCSLIESKWAY